MMLTLVLILLALVVAMLLCRGWTISRDELVVRARHGLLSRELRRKVVCVAHRAPSGALSFPEPREIRTRVLRLAGLPVWHEVSSVALPSGIEGRISAVRAKEFDHFFSSEFRISQATRFLLTLA